MAEKNWLKYFISWAAFLKNIWHTKRLRKEYNKISSSTLDFKVEAICEIAKNLAHYMYAIF